ncbi:MAG: glycosyltransferase family 1 protein [Ilumatobacteraceae bacterium]|nr:glycosyltransferase family 1 protein [Ilumatobacteraceae bacterium]
MPEPLRVAYTLEQCWHRVPGGTATATLEVARRLVERPDIEVVGVAGRHRRPPVPPFVPPGEVRSLPFGRPLLYETWNRFEWPRVEGATGAVDVCHSTTAIPAATSRPHVVTVHDIAFVDTPERFTRHGARVMRRGLDRCRSADLVLCPSRTTSDRLVEYGFAAESIRVVPWGVAAEPVDDADRARVRSRYDLPDDFVLFVGTVEPRKNLSALAAAAERLGRTVVAAGSAGWGTAGRADGDVRFLGFVPAADLPALYRLATVFAYPSLAEGFGLPVAEAMAYGTPVVTSAGTSTEEVAAGAAVLVDPTDAGSIATGIDEAIARAGELSQLGLARAAQLSWDHTVDATVAAYREVTA